MLDSIPSILTYIAATMKLLTIGQLSKKSEVSIQTIRYYERQGLIPKAQRSLSGYRLFTSEAVARINFIKQAQQLSFTLAEIEGLLSISADPKSTCVDAKKYADAKIADMEEKIKSLQRMKQMLSILAEKCHKNGSPNECPLLEFLETDTRRLPESGNFSALVNTGEK